MLSGPQRAFVPVANLRIEKKSFQDENRKQYIFIVKTYIIYM